MPQPVAPAPDRAPDRAPDQTPDVAPYDALLLVSFGGPEGPDDVLPFLENVTRGRGIPRERLAEVGEHYHLFGGRSPINDLNRAFLAAIREDLAAAGIDLPVYWGNRNWDPYLRDAVAQMAADGVTRAACFVTSAYSSWSSCRQYRENLYDASAEVAGHDPGDPEVLQADASTPRLEKLRHYFNHPGFVDPVVDATLAALADLPEDVRDHARLVFVTHSIPTAMNEASGPPEQGGRAYERQHLDVAAVVAGRVAAETGLERPHELAFCSRSGSPRTPWLEPDVNDRLREIAEQGGRAAVLVPVGFVSDHMEVIYDLDTEAAETAEEVGLAVRRAATPGDDPRFVAVVRDLLTERAAVERGEDVARSSVGETGPMWDRCPVGCCVAAGSERPALCGRGA